MDGIRNAFGEEELTTMGLTAAMLELRSSQHRDAEMMWRLNVKSVRLHRLESTSNVQ